MSGEASSTCVAVSAVCSLCGKPSTTLPPDGDEYLERVGCTTPECARCGIAFSVKAWKEMHK